MNVAIVGATGYGGLQLVSLLKNSTRYKISYLGGNKSSGSKWNELFPSLSFINNPTIEKISINSIYKKIKYSNIEFT
tara:strand:- start:231 stop:461 length:231 start_codon:yes stop_codon:yes gene_type:complete